MPCRDLTETLRVDLDTGERLLGYALGKRTCGVALVASNLLLPALEGSSAEEILALSPSDLPVERRDDAVLAFAREKHLRAIQALLAVYVGKQMGAPSSTCALSAILWEGDRIHIEAVLRNELDGAAVPPCGACSTCPGSPLTEAGSPTAVLL